MFSIQLMIVRQKKLTLNTPYSKINKVLWENKRLNSQKEKENMQLRTKIQKIDRFRNLKHPSISIKEKLEQKFQKLSQKSKEQLAWIKYTNNLIEEKNFESLKETVKKIQNKLNTVTQKALKLQKRLKKIMTKGKQNENSQKKEIKVDYTNEDPLDKLESDKRQLLSLLSYRKKEALQIDEQNKQLNKQLLALLAIKNRLREDGKQNNNPSQTDQCSSLCKAFNYGSTSQEFK